MAKFIFIFCQFLTQGKVTFAKSRLAPADFCDPIRDRKSCNPVILPEVSSTEVGFWSISDAGMTCDRNCETLQLIIQGVRSPIEIA